MSAEAVTLPTPDARIAAALWFAGHGFGIFPVWSTKDGRCRCPAGASCTSPGKHPITPNGFKDATTDERRIRTFLSAASEPNYGMLPPDGVFIWDVDTDAERERLAELEARHGPLPPTLRDDTGNGQHLFLRWPDGLPRPIHRMFGFVTRWGSGAAQGYVVGPLSVHVSGRVYRSAAGATADIATLPDAWARAAVEGEPGKLSFHATAGDPAGVAVGGRHDWLRNTARMYAGTVRDPDALFAAVWAANEKLAQPKTREEVRQAIGDVLQRFPADPEKAQETIRKAAEAGRVDAADLLGLSLPPLRMVIPGILPEGTTVLASPPKVGKSCLVYQMAVEVAIGGALFGERVAPGSVLYLALEDGQRRGQARLRAALDGRTMPHGRLEVQWAAPVIGSGLEESIETWLDEHPDAALVAVDTLQKVRKGGTGNRNAYEVDVEDLSRLQALFRDRSVALVIVHHSRKEAGDDFLASVSGTYGITGSADTIMVIRRKRLEAFGNIVVTGREIAETEVPARFDGLLWTQAPGAISEVSVQRREVYGVIEESGPLFAQAIATRLGLTRTSVQNMLTKMTNDGAIVATAKGYEVYRGSFTLSGGSSESSESSAPIATDDSADGVIRVTRNAHTDDSDDSDTGTDTPLPLPVSDDSDDSSDSEAVGSHQSHRSPTHAPTREGGPVVDCRDYRGHQDQHRHTAGGWVCLACDSEEGTA